MNLVGVDTETHLISAGCPAPRLVCVTIATDDGGEIFLREEGLDVIEALLADPDTTITGHHIFFDLAVAAAERERLLELIFDEIDAGRIHCTRLRQMIIDNAEGKLKFVWNEETNEYNRVDFTLQTLVKRHYGVDLDALKHGADAWRMRYNELDGVPLIDWEPEAVDYAVGDAVVTRGCDLKQEDYCAPHGLPGGQAAEISQVQAGWALYLMGVHGMRTEARAVAKLKAEVTAEYREWLEVAQRHGFIRRARPGKVYKNGKVGKPSKESRDMVGIKAAVLAWYEANQRVMKWTTGGKGGQAQIGTDREQLTSIECPACSQTFQGCSCNPLVTDMIVDGVHRGLWAVAEVVRLGKLLSTYIAALERGTVVPLNPSYNTIIETFRTSCSGGMKINGIPVGFNAQNPPRKHGVRECIVPRIVVEEIEVDDDYELQFGEEWAA